MQQQQQQETPPPQQQLPPPPPPLAAPLAPLQHNSFRLSSRRPFRPERVALLLEQAVTSALGDLVYDEAEGGSGPAECATRAVTLAGEIRSLVKALDYDRYKYIVKVDIGQKLDQGVCGMATFLWDAERDNYAYFSFENMKIFACAVVFAIYYD